MNEELIKILEVSAGETFEYDDTKTWLDLFKEQTAKNPGRTAVADEYSEFSYKELDELSGKIGAWLTQNGVGENQFVAVRMGRVKEFLAAVAGIWKAGAAYLPIDSDYPEERIRYMMEDSEAKITLTEEVIAGISRNQTGTIEGKTSPENLAYMIYTSGTTGNPKGVMIQHKALLNFVHFIRERWGLTENSRIACHSNYSFDASVEDLYPVLTAGGTLFIVPEEERHDIIKMRRFIKNHRITGGGYTTRFGQILSANEPLDLEYICLGGEAMTMVPNVTANVTGRIYNTYGPTEFTVDATYFELEKGKTYNPIPIGRPLFNCFGFIVDKENKLLPLGEIGELCMAGPQLSKGYWKRPELTAEKFNEIEVGDEKVKVYHTGDLAKYNEDGELEFYGRIDFQVKIRGFRVELPEIEEIIRHYDGIKDTTVVTFDKPSGEKYIVAYVVSDEKVDIDALHDFIAQSKPSYMIPAFTMQIDEIPLNQNQKVDKKRLPVPEYNLDDYEAPETETEKMICEKMAKALGLELFGVNDDFYRQGGDSLTTIVLIMECGHPGVNIASVQEYRTPRALAAYCDSFSDDAADIRTENEEAMKKSHPLSPGQLMYLKLQQDDPDALYCNIPTLFKLADDIDLVRLADTVNRVLANHPALKTKFIVDEKGEYRQIYDEGLFQPVQITEMTEDAFEAEKEKLVRPFALTDGCFWRGGIYKTPSDAYLFLDFHHIMSDGFSVRLLFDEIYACYQDPSHPLPEDYYFYLLGAPEREKGTRIYEEAADYCEKIFRGENALPEDRISLRADHEADKYEGAVKFAPLPIPKEKMSGNIPYLTACALTVCAYNQENSALVRCTHYGRNDRLSMSSVGLYANYYPILLVKEEGDTPETLISKVQEQVNFIESHLHYPYFEGNIDVPERIVRFIYQKDIMDLGEIVKLAKEVIDLDTDNEDATDSLFGASVIDDPAFESLMFVERYAGNCYDEESSAEFMRLFYEAAGFLGGEK